MQSAAVTFGSGAVFKLHHYLTFWLARHLMELGLT